MGQRVLISSPPLCPWVTDPRLQSLGAELGSKSKPTSRQWKQVFFCVWDVLLCPPSSHQGHQLGLGRKRALSIFTEAAPILQKLFG